MKVHPVAELFPMMGKAELAALAEDIRKNGLRNPIVVQGGVLIDGRNRLAACEIAEVYPTRVEYEGDSPVSYIISANLLRRNLDKGQKIALGIEIEPHFAEEAKKRQKEHGSTAPGRKSVVEKVPQVIECPDCHCEKPSWFPADEPLDDEHEYVQCEECGYCRRVIDKRQPDKSRDIAARVTMTEREWVTFLYELRGYVPPTKMLDGMAVEI